MIPPTLIHGILLSGRAPLFIYLYIHYQCGLGDVDFIRWTVIHYCLFVLFLFFWPRHAWDLSSQTRDRTRIPYIGRWILNH